MKIQHNRELEGLPWQSSSKHSKPEIYMPYKQKTALYMFVCVCVYTYILRHYICIFLPHCHGMWYLSLPTRDQSHALYNGIAES